MNRLCFLAGLGLGTLAILSTADAASLNVKTGLWEMTTTGGMSGRPPIPQEYLARLTPEQRAKYEQGMAASMATSNKTHVNQHCVTTDDLQRGLDVAERDDSETRKCQKAVMTNTGTVMDFRQTCTGRENMTILMHFEAVNPQTVTGTMDMTMSGGGNTMTAKYQISGKWLGSDCGAMKKK